MLISEKSKADSSFIYATRFSKLGINTPEPIAFILYKDKLGLTRSYYICRQLDYDFTFRGISNLPQQEQETVLQEFVRFTYAFHQKGVYFIDHSAGNTLIKKNMNGTFSFYLVDLNRTKFTNVTTKEGLRNLSKLEASHNMLTIMGREYALLTHCNTEATTKKLIQLTDRHNKITERKAHLEHSKKNQAPLYFIRYFSILRANTCQSKFSTFLRAAFPNCSLSLSFSIKVFSRRRIIKVYLHV